MANPPALILRLEALEAKIASLQGIIPPGTFIMSPFRADALSGYVYCANGDRYPLESPQGEVILGFSAQYKADWSITVVYDTINLPNLFAPDGRGYFFRAAETPGGEQGDAIRNIKSGANNVIFTCFSTGTDLKPFVGGNRYTESRHFEAVVSSGYAYNELGIDVSTIVPTADENRPINRGLVPGVYLGV